MITSPINSLLAAGSRQVYKLTFTLPIPDPPYTQTFTITEGSIIIGGTEIEESGVCEGSLNIDRYTASGQMVEIGSAIAAELTVDLANFTGILDDVMFANGEVFVEVGTQDWSDPNATPSYIPMGYFDIDSQPRRRSVICISALDRMARFDKQIGAITLPITVANLVAKACTDCGVTLGMNISSLPNASYSVTQLPEEFTYRQIIQQCAFLMGSCAYIDEDGELAFGWYHSESYTINSAHRILDSSDLFESDVQFTGLVYKDTEGTEYVAGLTGYTYNYESCDLLAGATNIQNIITAIWGRVQGLTYRPFRCTVLSAPFLWPLDKINYLDADNQQQTVIITNINYTGNAQTALQAVGESTVQAGWSNFSGMTLAQRLAIMEATERVEQKITVIHGTCDTSDGITQKDVVCSAFDLKPGSRLSVDFTYGESYTSNSASGRTISINGAAGIPIYVSGGQLGASNQLLWASGATIEFLYDGTSWTPTGYHNTYYGACTTAGNQNKEASIPDVVICKGVEMILSMSHANEVVSPTLNISNTGAKTIYAQGSTLTADSELGWTAGANAVFVFDGQYWVLGNNHINAGSITVGKLTAITIEGPTSETYWELTSGEWNSHGEEQFSDESREISWLQKTDVNILNGRLKIKGEHENTNDWGYASIVPIKKAEYLRAGLNQFGLMNPADFGCDDSIEPFGYAGFLMEGETFKTYGKYARFNDEGDFESSREDVCFVKPYVELTPLGIRFDCDYGETYSVADGTYFYGISSSSSVHPSTWMDKDEMTAYINENVDSGVTPQIYQDGNYVNYVNEGSEEYANGIIVEGNYIWVTDGYNYDYEQFSTEDWEAGTWDWPIIELDAAEVVYGISASSTTQPSTWISDDDMWLYLADHTAEANGKYVWVRKYYPWRTTTYLYGYNQFTTEHYQEDYELPDFTDYLVVPGYNTMELNTGFSNKSKGIVFGNNVKHWWEEDPNTGDLIPRRTYSTANDIEGEERNPADFELGPGDSFMLGDTTIWGRSFSSRTKILVTIPLPKPISSNVTGLDFNSAATITIRRADGSSALSSVNLKDNFTWETVDTNGDVSLNIHLIKKSGTVGTTNGEMLCLIFSQSATITLK